MRQGWYNGRVHTNEEGEMVGHSSGLLLLTAVAGYWVLERAETHKKGDLRRAGKVLGWLIIVVSLIGVACNVWCLATCRTPYGSMSKKAGFCPFGPQTPPPPSQSQ